MTDTRDPRGIVTFIVRYLVLHVVFLVGLVLTYTTDLGLVYAFGFTGVFTFFQVLASISRDFLVRTGSWKAVVIAGTVLTDVPILWWLGRLVAGIAGSGSDWWLVTSLMPFHLFAAFFAWGIRETIHSPAPQQTATPSISDSPADPAETENPGDSNVADAPTATPASTEADANKMHHLSCGAAHRS